MFGIGQQVDEDGEILSGIKDVEMLGGFLVADGGHFELVIAGNNILEIGYGSFLGGGGENAGIGVGEEASFGGIVERQATGVEDANFDEDRFGLELDGVMRGDGGGLGGLRRGNDGDEKGRDDGARKAGRKRSEKPGRRHTQLVSRTLQADYSGGRKRSR